MKDRVTIEKLIVGSMSTNCYLIIDGKSKKTLIVDPGDDAEYIIDKLTQLRAKPIGIVATHGHFDHVMGARSLQLVYAPLPFLIHADDIFLLKRMQESVRHFLGIASDPPPEVSNELKDKETLKLEKTSLAVVHVPGHTPGSICLSLGAEKLLFVGDTIFAEGAVGRTDFSYSSQGDLKASLKKILAFPGDTQLLTGHGEDTSIDKEKTYHRV